jgi:hypothetical protein
MFVAGPSHTTPFTTIPASLQRLIVPFTKAAISTPLRFPLVKKYPTIFSSPLFYKLEHYNHNFTRNFRFFLGLFLIWEEEKKDLCSPAGLF